MRTCRRCGAKHPRIQGIGWVRLQQAGPNFECDACHRPVPIPEGFVLWESGWGQHVAPGFVVCRECFFVEDEPGEPWCYLAAYLEGTHVLA
jgi:hypothetical protein